MPECTVEFDLHDNRWIKVNDDRLGPGGKLIKGGARLYYIGGIDPKTGNKSKIILEYKGEFGWEHWPAQELPVQEEARNSWDVMEVHPQFCRGAKNMTRSSYGTGAWDMRSTNSKDVHRFCFKHEYEFCS